MEVAERPSGARQTVTAALLLLAAVAVWAPRAGAAVAGGASRQITLRTGESEEVAFPPATDLSVSRRGVVDLFHLGGGRWQITGLHAGFVVIDARDGTTGDVRLPRLFVEVRSRKDAEAEDEAGPTLPPWLCAPRGIHCDAAAGIIAGEAPSHLWLARAHAACQEGHGCLLAAKLAPTALAAWTTELQQILGPDYTVTPSAAGFPLITAFCGRAGRQRRLDAVDAATDDAAAAGLVAVRCREDDGLRYRLRAKIDLVEESAARDLGFDGLAVLQLGLAAPGSPPPRQDARLLARLHALEEQRRAVIVGEPVVRLAPDVESELVSGGEFQTVEQVVRVDRGSASETIAAWKQFGLTLKLTAEPRDAGHARLTYDMTFRARAQAGDRVSDQELAVNQLRTTVDVPLGAPVMAGVLDLRTDGRDTGGVPFLAHVPFVGPLFARTATQLSTSRLVFWLQLDEDCTESGELPQNVSPSR